MGARRKFALPSLIISLHNKLKKWAKSPHEIAFNLLEPGQKILDIGCGDGQFLALVKDKFNELYGIDISPLAIEKARNYCLQMGVGERLKLILWDVENGLPFEDSIFDAVTCLAVLEHVFYPPSLLKEISRVLKVGGVLVLQVPNDVWLLYRIQFLLGKIPHSGGIDDLGYDWGHLHKFSKEIIEKLLTSCNFSISTLLCSGVFPNLRKVWLSLLGGDIIVKAVKN
ncbi:MAG: class I SAM-dependent methyltransferase [Thermoproteota archaeon]